jgi:CheY-like chemotaxis protein
MDTGNVPKAKVLIVDDQPQMRAFLRAALKTLPVQIMDLDNGFEAMALVETEQPDLLLIDYLMPGLDGITFCQDLRRRTDLKPIKTVLITGETTPALLLEAVNHKTVDAALAKPVDVHELQQLVKRLLA